MLPLACPWLTLIIYLHTHLPIITGLSLSHLTKSFRYDYSSLWNTPGPVSPKQGQPLLHNPPSPEVKIDTTLLSNAQAVPQIFLFLCGPDPTQEHTLHVVVPLQFPAIWGNYSSSVRKQGAPQNIKNLKNYKKRKQGPLTLHLSSEPPGHTWIKLSGRDAQTCCSTPLSSWSQDAKSQRVPSLLAICSWVTPAGFSLWDWRVPSSRY